MDTKTNKQLFASLATLTILCGCGQKTEPDNKQSGSNPGNTSQTSTNQTPQSVADFHVAQMPDDTVICTVNGKPIKAGEYKCVLRIQQIQSTQNLMSNPEAKSDLLKEAKNMGVELSAQDKSEILASARKQKGGPEAFKEFLKKSGMNETQFDNEVLSSTLALKTSSEKIERGLLNDLINRELLAQAAQASGGEKQASGQTAAVKQTPQFQSMVMQTQSTPQSVEEEIMKSSLAKIQASTLAAQANVQDEEVKKLYEQNKAKMHHGARIRMSKILILCPEKDLGPLLSVRNQIKKNNPKLSDKELDSEVKKYLASAKERAKSLFEQAKKTANFAALANDNSMDPQTHATRNGGDMGYIEKQNLNKELLAAVSKMKPGDLYPEVVKNEVGYTIYKITAIEEPGEISFEEAKPMLLNDARQQKMSQVMSQWIEAEKKKAKIVMAPQFESKSKDKQQSATH